MVNIIYIHWLVVSHILEIGTPTDELIFFRGVGIPPSRSCEVREMRNCGLKWVHQIHQIWYWSILSNSWVYIYIWISLICPSDLLRINYVATKTGDDREWGRYCVFCTWSHYAFGILTQECPSDLRWLMVAFLVTRIGLSWGYFDLTWWEQGKWWGLVIQFLLDYPLIVWLILVVCHHPHLWIWSCFQSLHGWFSQRGCTQNTDWGFWLCPTHGHRSLGENHEKSHGKKCEKMDIKVIQAIYKAQTL